MLLLGLFLGLAAQTESAPELLPISRNSVIFVESTKAGEEWEAFRLTDATHASVFKAAGPAKLLFRVRTLAEGPGAVAAILVDERIVLTARVENEVDSDAHIVSDKQSVSRIHFYLVKLAAGDHRVTLRFSEGAPLLVSGLLTALSASEAAIAAAEDDVPLAEPPAVDRVQRADASDDESAAEEPEQVALRKELAAADGDGAAPPPSGRGLEPSTRTGPREDESVIPPRRGKQVAAVDRRLTVRAPYFLFEVRGGARFSAIDVNPSPMLGVDARFPMPGFDSRVLTLGISGELAANFGDAPVYTVRGGAPVDVVELSHTTLLGAFDARWAFYRFEEALEVYGSLGIGAQLGTLSAENASSRLSASSRAMFGRARLGATLGIADSRPFLEIAIDGGGFSSDLARPTSDSAAGATTPYAAATLAVGYRVELLTDADVE